MREYRSGIQTQTIFLSGWRKTNGRKGNIGNRKGKDVNTHSFLNLT